MLSTLNYNLQLDEIDDIVSKNINEFTFDLNVETGIDNLNEDKLWQYLITNNFVKTIKALTLENKINKDNMKNMIYMSTVDKNLVILKILLENHMNNFNIDQETEVKTLKTIFHRILRYFKDLNLEDKKLFKSILDMLNNYFNNLKKNLKTQKDIENFEILENTLKKSDKLVESDKDEDGDVKMND